MADCSEIFFHYNEKLKLSDEKREMLVRVREDLRNRMQNNYRLIPGDIRERHNLNFQTQGSFVMDTIITPYDDDFDLDDGVYFFGNLNDEERPLPHVYHEWVIMSIKAEELYGKVTDKVTCVRFRVAKEKFHIDLPIYYVESIDSPDLAHTKEGWLLSNAIEFIVWFESKVGSNFNSGFITEQKLFTDFQKWTTEIRKTDAQLRRIVRYLKGWGDNLRDEMPPGIVMTILAGENFKPNIREDVAFRDTLLAIQQYLKKNNNKCIRPTTPMGEDLFASYSSGKLEYFIDKLNSFIDSANQAIEKGSKKEACLKWQKHFGDRFDCRLVRESDVELATVFPIQDRIRHDNKSA
jgi:hypothetical protein